MPVERYECTYCDSNVAKCSLCLNFFYNEDTIYCHSESEKHVCEQCYARIKEDEL